MALGFNYTLSVNESASLKNLEDFTKKLNGTTMKIGIDFDMDSFNSMIDKIQDKLDGITDKLKLEFGEFDVDIEALQKQLKKVGDKVKLNIPAEIEVKEAEIEKPLETTGRSIGDSVEKQIQVIQDSLILSLNNLAQKVSKNGMDDIIPVEDIMQSIDQLGKMDLKIQDVNKQAKLIRQEIQSWNQVTTAQTELFKTTATAANDVADAVIKMNKSNADNDLERQTKILKQNLDIQMDNIKASKEYSKLNREQLELFRNLSNSMQLTGNSIKEVKEKYQELNYQIKEFKQNNITPLVGQQENAFGKLFSTISSSSLIFNVMQEAWQGAKQVIKDSVGFIRELDEAYTNINQTMTISQREFDDWVDKATQTANETGTLTSDVLKMMKTYASAGESIENINAKLAGTTAFQNVTGMAAEEVTNSVQSIMNQYKMAQDSTDAIANSMQHLGDVMVGVAYSLQKEESLAMKDIISGVETAGAVIESAGGSFEWLSAVVGTLSEQMNATGDETGNAMKMIAARTLQSKEAIEELAAAGEDMSDMDIKASNAEKALAEVGVSVRNSTGDFKDLEDILGEVAKKWDTLNGTQKQMISEQLAGNNRRNYFISMMENYERVAELMDNAKNSQGAFFEASEKQAESLAGKTNQLKNAWTELYQQILSADMLKDGTDFLTTMVNGLSKLIQNIDKVIPVVVGLTTALIALDVAANGSNSAIGKLATKVIDMGKSMATTATKIGVAKAAMAGLAGVIVGIGVAALTAWINKAKEKQERLESMADAMNDYKESAEEANNVDSDIQSYKQLSEELKDMNITTEERLQKEQELEQVKNRLSQQTGFKEILEQENALLSNQVAAMEGLAEAEKKRKAADLWEQTEMSSKDIANDVSVLEGYTKEGGGANYWDEHIKAQQELMEQLRQQQQGLNEDTKEYQRLQTEIEAASKLITDYQLKDEKSKQRFIESYERLAAYQEAGLIAEEAGFHNSREQLEVLEKMKPYYEQIKGIQQDTVDSSKDQLETEQKITDEKEQQAQYSFGNDDGESALAKTVKAQDELNQAYLDSLTYLQEANDLIALMKDGLSVDDMNTILDSDLMNDFTGAIDNATDVTEHLKGKMQEMQDVAYETYGNMMLADDDYWTQAMRKCAEALGVNSIEFIDYINEKGLARKVDVNNAKNATDAENQMNMSLNRQLMQGYVAVVNSKAGNRKTDMGNVVNFLNTQEAKEAQTIDELKAAWAAYYNAKVKAVQREYLDLKYSIKDMDAGQVDPAVYKQLQDLNNSIQNWYQTNKDVQNYFAGITSTFNGVSNTLSQAAASAGAAIAGATSGSGSTSKPSSSSGSSGSGSATQREVEDMESLVDRYYQLNDAINMVTKALDKNREKQATVKTKSEYKKLVEEEISLINKEITALSNLQKEQQKERNEIQKTLKTNGFTFDSNNNITNYAKQLKKLTDQANKITDPDKKEAAQKQVQAIADLIDRYTELEDNTIPETALEMENLKNEIEEINKTFEENMKLVEQLGDRYFDVMNKLADVENKLTMNDKLQANAVGQEKLKLMKEELQLIAQKQKLLKEQQSQAESEAKKLQEQLRAEGVKFDKNGNVSNYEALTKQLTDNANKLVGDAQQEALDHAQNILDLIDQYVTLTDDTIPGLQESWQDYANEVEDIQTSMTELVVDMQKQVTQVYEEEQNKRYNKLQENLQKERDAINKAYDEDTYTKGLQSQQNELDEISQQIAIYSRDTSEVGKARLAQLKQEYQTLQDQINESLRERENELANERFDEESAALDEELSAILAPENLVNVVNQAITSGMVTVGDEVVKLDELMTTWMDESGDGLYALGGQLKSELIDNLQAAKTIMDEMGLTGMASLSKAFPTGTTTSNNNTINFNQPLVAIEGGMTTDADIEAMAEQLKNEVYKAISDAMK